MQPKSDAQLLREYAENGSEAAFTELVTRYTNLVYSAALRQVDSSDLAAELAQRVFVGLARGAQALAPRLPEDASLAGWLCRSIRNLNLNHRRDEFRRHSRERQAMETFCQTSESSPDWENLGPILDEAMSKLSEADSDAVVMRFFNNQDLRAVGRALGVSDDTAQKRVSRALDKLRHYFSRRGVRTSSGALAIALSANAVQAAPAGLAAAISTAAAASGAAVPVLAAPAAAKTITMTALQKAIVTAALTAAIGVAVYETSDAVRLGGQVQKLEQQRDGFSQRVGQFEQERSQAAQVYASLQQENQRLARGPQEVRELQGELARLRTDSQELARLRAMEQQREQDADYATAKSWLTRSDAFKTWMDAHPEQQLPEFQYLFQDTWLDVVKDTDVAGDNAHVARMLRDRARDYFGVLMGLALQNFVKEHNGELPGDLRQLNPYLWLPMTDELLNAYKLVYSGKIEDVPKGDWPIVEVRPPERPGDPHLAIGANLSTRTY